MNMRRLNGTMLMRFLVSFVLIGALISPLTTFSGSRAQEADGTPTTQENAAPSDDGTVDPTVDTSSGDEQPVEEPTVETTPTDEPIPTDKPAPSIEPQPSDEPAPSEEPAPSDSPAPSEEPAPSDNPAPSDSPAPSEKPAPSDEPAASADPSSSAAPSASVAPESNFSAQDFEAAATSGTLTILKVDGNNIPLAGACFDVTASVAGGSLAALLALLNAGLGGSDLISTTPAACDNSDGQLDGTISVGGVLPNLLTAIASDLANPFLAPLITPLLGGITVTVTLLETQTPLGS